MAMVNCGVQMILGFVLGMGVFAVIIGIKKIRVRQAVVMIKQEDKAKQEVIQKAEQEVINAKKQELMKTVEEVKRAVIDQTITIKKRGRPKNLKENGVDGNEILGEQDSNGQSTTETNNQER